MLRNPKLVNYALYQAGWFCCVLGAANERPWMGTAVGIALILVHVARVPRPLEELKLLLAAGLVGGVLDSLQSWAGLLVVRSGHVAESLAPPWIVVMWMQFATLFRFGLSFLLGRYVLGAVLAALGGPLAFWVGSRLGAVQFPPPASRSLIVLGLVWAGALPLLLWLTARWTETDPSGRHRGLGATRAE
jgi:hypothetical protein